MPVLHVRISLHYRRKSYGCIVAGTGRPIAFAYSAANNGLAENSWLNSCNKLLRQRILFLAPRRQRQHDFRKRSQI